MKAKIVMVKKEKLKQEFKLLGNTKDIVDVIEKNKYEYEFNQRETDILVQFINNYITQEEVIKEGKYIELNRSLIDYLTEEINLTTYIKYPLWIYISLLDYLSTFNSMLDNYSNYSYYIVF